MYKLFLLSFLITIIPFTLFADTNTTNKDKNTTKERIAKEVKEQMAREAEYAKSQSFAQGDDYDLKAVEVNVKSLDNIPSIEPDYDFDMTDVYRDDI